jgi:L-lactate dehydrogenase complex protein LldF
VLIHLRGRVVREQKSKLSAESLAMQAVGRAFASQKGYERAQKLAQAGRGPLGRRPPGLKRWTEMRELPEVPRQTFREWWRSR